MLVYGVPCVALKGLIDLYSLISIHQEMPSYSLVLEVVSVGVFARR